MDVAIMLTLIGVVSWLFVQTVLCAGYFRAAGQSPPQMPAGSRRPRVCVVMPVRGAESTLAAAIRQVLAQDYPDFSLKVVVDSREDPAWAVAEAEILRSRPGRAELAPLSRPRSSCSLVCSSVLQVVEALDDTFELVVFCAADMIVPDNWLQTMAAAMVDCSVGATLGNRWYLPPRANAGGLLRYLWNAGAVVTMWCCQIPWSGALAVRPVDLRESGLLRLWGRSLVEDVPSATAMRRYGKRLQFVPGLLVGNYDEIGVKPAFRFICRQMLWARLYHPAWWLIAGNGLAGAALQGSILGLLFLAWQRGEAGSAVAMALVFAAYVGGLAGLLLLVEAAVYRSPAMVGATRQRFAGLPLFWVLPAIPLTQFAYALTLIVTLFARQVSWCGIRYRFSGPWEVRMVDYQPYRR